MSERLVAGPFEWAPVIWPWLKRGLVIIVGIAAYLMFVALAHADCANMQRLAQNHSNDMARRGRLDHKGFGVVDGRCVGGRCAKGARAENVGLASSKEAVMEAWRNSPLHAINMQMSGCKAVANSGRYWTMIVGQ